jgi:hypothetical protein
VIAASILVAIGALAVLAGALRVRALLPAVASAGALAAAWLTPVVSLFLSAVALALRVISQLVWTLLDDE